MSDLDFFYPNDFTYVSLTQSGDFKIIKNHTIRNLLVKLYSSYESIDREQSNLINNLDNNFFPAFYESYNMANKRILDRTYFQGASLANYAVFTMDKLNTISIYFDRSRNLAEQAVEAINKELE